MVNILAKYRCLIFSLLILNSCDDKIIPTLKSKQIDYDSKTGILKIYEDSLNDLKEVILIPKQSNQKQIIRITDNFKISHLENRIRTFEDKNYLNTIIAFDRQGNFDYFDSYYYISAPYKNKRGEVYVSCILDRSLFNDEIFAVVGEYDELFQLKTKGNIDTIRFSNDREVFIPISNPKQGKNNLRFKIIDQKKTNNDTIRQRVIFVDKDFWIK